MPTELLFLFLFFITGFFIFLYFVPINLWIIAVFSGVEMQLLDLVFMRIRKTPVKTIVNSLIAARKGGVKLSTADLEAHHLAGGDVEAVVRCLILAKAKGIPLDMKEVAAWDLSNRNLDEALKEKANVSTDKDLKISIARKLDTLSDSQLQEVGRFLEGM